MERVLYGMKQTICVSSRVGWPALSDLWLCKSYCFFVSSFHCFYVSLFLVFFSRFIFSLCFSRTCSIVRYVLICNVLIETKCLIGNSIKCFVLHSSVTRYMLKLGIHNILFFHLRIQINKCSVLSFSLFVSQIFHSKNTKFVHPYFVLSNMQYSI